MTEYQYPFERLEIWQLGIDFSVEVYKCTKSFPSEEKFGLISQLRRASSSISTNIAEGSSRYSKKEMVRFYEIAYGSAVECLSLLYLSNKLEFIEKDQLMTLRKQIETITNKINGYVNAIKRNANMK